MANFYDKSTLQQISSPEQLDKTLRVTSPMSWLSIAAIGLILLCVLVWSIFGTIPMTVTAQGILASPVSTNAVYAKENGEVLSVLVSPGDALHLGDEILRYRSANGEVATLTSDQVGTVSDIMTEIGSTLYQGSEAIRISPKVSSPHVAVCYIPLQDAGKIERGMSVHIYLSSVDSQNYGHMEARVINIDSHAASEMGMQHVLGSGNALAAGFSANGAVAAVTCELYPADTVSGYYWPGKKGAVLSVSGGSLLSAKIVTEEIAPITKLFSKLGEIF